MAARGRPKATFTDFGYMFDMTLSKAEWIEAYMLLYLIIFYHARKNISAPRWDVFPQLKVDCSIAPDNPS